MPSNFSLKFIFDFIPALKDVPPTIFDQLTKKMNRIITNHDEIKGVFLLSAGKYDPVIYSKNIKNYQKIQEMSELLHSFGIEPLIKDLASRGYHGSSAMTFPEFGLGMIKISDNEIIAVLVGDQPDQYSEDKIKIIIETIKNEVFPDLETTLKTIPNPRVKTDEETINTSTIPKPDEK